MSGVHTIQLLPIEKENNSIARFKRRLEGHILKRYHEESEGKKPDDQGS